MYLYLLDTYQSVFFPDLPVIISNSIFMYIYMSICNYQCLVLITIPFCQVTTQLKKKCFGLGYEFDNFSVKSFFVLWQRLSKKFLSSFFSHFCSFSFGTNLLFDTLGNHNVFRQIDIWPLTIRISLAFLRNYFLSLVIYSRHHHFFFNTGLLVKNCPVTLFIFY